MKAIVFSSIAVAIAVAVWQQAELGELRSKESAVVATLAQSDAQSVVAKPSTSPETAPVSDDELRSFTNDLHLLRTELLRTRVHFESAFQERNDLCDTLRRLTADQIRAVVATLDKEVGHNFMFTAGKVSPRAVLEVMYQMRSEHGETGAPGHAPNAFENWLYEDPAALLNWAREKGFPEGFDNACAQWAAAAAAVVEPTPENMAKLFPIKGYFCPASHVIVSLPTQDARVTFFRSLHDAIGGASDGDGFYPIFAQFTRHVPFAQASRVADSVPMSRFGVVESHHIVGIESPRTNGSLRYNIARMSRDGTIAERWNWLVSRPEDRPTEVQTNGLIQFWCERDYAEVAAWARGLSNGSERTAVKKAIVKFFGKRGGRTDLSTEWTAP